MALSRLQSYELSPNLAQKNLPKVIAILTFIFALPTEIRVSIHEDLGIRWVQLLQEQLNYCIFQCSNEIRQLKDGYGDAIEAYKDCQIIGAV